MPKGCTDLHNLPTEYAQTLRKIPSNRVPLYQFREESWPTRDSISCTNKDSTYNPRYWFLASAMITCSPFFILQKPKNHREKENRIKIMLDRLAFFWQNIWKGKKMIIFASGDCWLSMKVNWSREKPNGLTEDKNEPHRHLSCFRLIIE